jgi:hypothetical protein
MPTAPPVIPQAFYAEPDVAPAPPVEPKQEPKVVDTTNETIHVEDDQTLTTKQAGGELDKFLKKGKFETLEDAWDAIEESRAMQEKLSGHDVEDLFRASEELARINAYWAQQKEKELRDDETEQETIDRLEKQLKAERERKSERDQQLEEAQEAKRVIKGFNDYTSSIIDEDDDIPNTHKPLMKLLCGVDNMMNEIDITKNSDIKRMKKEHAKVINKFAQSILDAAVKNSGKILPVSETVQPATKGVEPTKAKSINEAEKLAAPLIQRFFQNLPKRK